MQKLLRQGGEQDKTKSTIPDCGQRDQETDWPFTTRCSEKEGDQKTTPPPAKLKSWSQFCWLWQQRKRLLPDLEANCYTTSINLAIWLDRRHLYATEGRIRQLDHTLWSTQPPSLKILSFTKTEFFHTAVEKHCCCFSMIIHPPSCLNGKRFLIFVRYISVSYNKS